LRTLRANRVFGADEKRIRTKNTIMNKTNGGLGLFQDRRLRADGFIVRAQSVIRADGSPSAQAAPLQCEQPQRIQVRPYSDLCVPSQNGAVLVRLHPHNAFVSVAATVNFTGVNGPPLCEPSQNGCFFD
jgi:hypothetical protein